MSLLSLLAFLPSPIVFGRLVDSSCRVWGERCGERTNCLLYDTDALRLSMGLMAAGCLALATLCDAAVWWMVGELDLYDDDEGGEGREKKGEMHTCTIHIICVSLKDKISSLPSEL